MKAYRQTIEQLVQKLDSNIKTGLTKQEVERRIKTHGLNELPARKRAGWFAIFLSQFQNPLIYILVAAAAIIFFVGETRIDAFIISGVLIFNAIIGTIQEGRTESIIESLKRFIKTQSIVIRDGKKEVVQDTHLVPGDIILLQEGQRVPADARVIESNNMKVDESVLTGESGMIRKTTQVIDKQVPLGDRNDMVYKGTYVLGGSGKALVVATGIHTEIGTIHKTVEEIKTDIPLRKELDRLSYVILIFILGMCVFLLLLGIFAGKPLQELLVMLTALFICVVPEGLPVVMTLVLVSGALKMAKEQVLIKNLQAVDALGRTDVIVIDKTGTLTRNELIVHQLMVDHEKYEVSGQGYFVQGGVYKNNEEIMQPDKNSDLWHMAVAANILNSSEVSYIKQLKLFDIKGDPTEAALYVFSEKLGFNRKQLDSEFKKIYELPFDSEYRYHAAFYEHNNKGIVYIIGSPERLMKQSKSVDQQTKDTLKELLDHGLRVVAAGMKEIDLAAVQNAKDESAFRQLIKDDVTFLGLYGIQDSIRPEVPAIIKQARDAGIKVIMATGDHKETALYVAEHVGLFQPGDKAIAGTEFAKISDDELLQQLDQTTVYARVSPADKMRIINLFHQQKKIVAMTGDGINDAPSLVAADLGIAMGGIGTEVAKQAADIVLLDDSFMSIMNAVEQGRHIFYTLRRVILYFFATNMGEILIVLFALFTNMPLPITAAQILWLNLVTDGFLDIALSTEPKEKGLLRASWLQQKLRLVDKNVLLKMLFISIPMGLVSLAVFWYDLPINGLTHARTMTLITMAMFQWFNAWNCRSETLSIFQSGLFTNKWLILATAFVLFLQVLILHVPFMQYLFQTVPLSTADWGLIVCVSFPIIILEEIRKLIVRHITRYN